MLENEQNYYCPYCERSVSGTNHDAHIEHIKPRDLFPQFFQEYNNMIISCIDNNTCGMYKSRYFNESLFINPVVDDPNKYFCFNIASGEVIPKCEDKESINYKKAKYTIELLNLNYSKIRDARKNLIDMLQYYDNESIQWLLEENHNFPSLIKYFMDNYK